MNVIIDTDKLRERLRERATEDRRGVSQYCENCQAGLSPDDVENDECSNCGSGISGDHEEDMQGEVY